MARVASLRRAILGDGNLRGGPEKAMGKVTSGKADVSPAPDPVRAHTFESTDRFGFAYIFHFIESGTIRDIRKRANIKADD